MANNTGSGAIDPTQLMSNPVLAQLIQNDPTLLSSLSGGAGAASTGPLMGNDLASALMGSAMDVTGTYGQTGHAFKGVLPPWAANLPAEVTGSPDFNPYLGVVSQSGDERVYFGDKKQRVVNYNDPTAPANKFASEMAGPTQTQGETTSHVEHSDKTKTVTQALNMPYTWSEDEVAQAVQRLKAAGMQVDSFDGGSNSLVAAWGQLVNRAAMMYDLSDGKRKVTPWDVLDLYKKEGDAAGLGPFSGKKVTVQRNVTDITEGEAWSQLQNNLSQMLGRDPSDQELRDFTYRMNQMAAQNPAISKTVTRYKNGEAVGSSTHTDPGFTSADMAQKAYDQAQNAPDYAEYRGASYLFNAVMSALGPIGG